MGLPKILIKGNLCETKFSPPKSELDKHVPKDYILEYIRERKGKVGIKNRLLILESETGSGKSTVIPPEIWHVFNKVDGRQVVSTQPRVFNAKDIPYTIVPYHTKEWLKETGQTGRQPIVIGENIGYETGDYSLKPKEGIIFMTYGTLVGKLQSMENESLLNTYQVILVDEAHERSEASNLLHYVLKQMLLENKSESRCPFVIITSATIDPEIFTKYYGVSLREHIKVSGLAFPIKEHYLEHPSGNYIESIVKTVIHIHKTTPLSEDVLIFVPGAMETMSIMSKLRKHSDPILKKKPIYMIELSSKTVAQQTDEVKNINTQMKQRKVIVSTNVGETGITYSTVIHVLDSGYYRKTEYFPTYDYEVLVTKPVSDDIRRQRRGRVGRIQRGEFWGMYTKPIVDKLLIQKMPDVITTEATLGILKYMITKLDGTFQTRGVHEVYSELPKVAVDITKADLLDKYAKTAVANSLAKMYYLGFIDANRRLTFSGVAAGYFRFVCAEQIKVVLSGYQWGVHLDDVIAVTIFMDQDKRRIYSGAHRSNREKFKAQYPYDKLMNIMSCDFCEFIMYYQRATELICETGKLESVESIGLKPDTFARMLKQRDRIIKCIQNAGLDLTVKTPTLMDVITNSESDVRDLIDVVKRIKHMLYCALKLNVAKWNGKFYMTKGMPLTTKISGYKKIMYWGLNVDVRRYSKPKNIDKVSVLDGYVSTIE
jgi:HrpA-like RNA helicase